MEHEVTTFDFFFFMADKIYGLMMMLMMVGVIFYTVNEKGFALLVTLSIFAIIIKTIGGLFNGSLLADILQYYLDLGIVSFMGRFSGEAYLGYITDFYNFNAMNMVVPFILAVVMIIIRSMTVNKRVYYNKI